VKTTRLMLWTARTPAASKCPSVSRAFTRSLGVTSELDQGSQFILIQFADALLCVLGQDEIQEGLQALERPPHAWFSMVRALASACSRLVVGFYSELIINRSWIDQFLSVQLSKDRLRQ
jgi:hypothetical protein